MGLPLRAAITNCVECSLRDGKAEVRFAWRRDGLSRDPRALLCSRTTLPVARWLRRHHGPFAHMYPRPRTVDRFAIHLQPLAHCQECLLLHLRDGAVTHR